MGQIKGVEARFPTEYEVLRRQYLNNCYESEPGPMNRECWGEEAREKLGKLLAAPVLAYAVERVASVFGAIGVFDQVHFCSFRPH